MKNKNIKSSILHILFGYLLMILFLGSLYFDINVILSQEQVKCVAFISLIISIIFIKLVSKTKWVNTYNK